MQRAPVVLLVVTLDRATARWARKPWDIGGGNSFVPLVVGPDHIPVVTCRASAVNEPELALLSAIVHRDSDDIVNIAQTVALAAAQLDDERGALCADLLTHALGPAARLALEEFMRTSGYRYPQSDFARKHFGLGKAEGKVEGKAEGEADSLLTVLKARGFSVGPDLEESIRACTDTEQLLDWLHRAATAKHLSDVFDR